VSYVGWNDNSAGVDGRVTLVDGSNGKSKQQWNHHTAPVLDIDWRNDTSFATCSTVCRSLPTRHISTGRSVSPDCSLHVSCMTGSTSISLYNR
jgi:hypothetical protein